MTAAHRPEPAGQNDDVARARFAHVAHRSKITSLISGAAVLVALVPNLFWLEKRSLPLFGVASIAAVMFILSVWVAGNLSSRVMARLSGRAHQLGGRFALWAPGSGENAGTPFAYGVSRERFGVLTYSEHGMPIEIGNLSTQVAAGHASPMGRSIAYVAIRLPQRMPHMFLRDFRWGHAVMTAWLPRSWHRSQLLEVGDGSRIRVFVGDGGQEAARAFLTPGLVRLLFRVRREYDVEIKDRMLYLYSGRSIAAGTERRRSEQQRLIADLVSALAESDVWELLRRQSRGRGPTYRPLRQDPARRNLIITVVIVVAVTLISAIVLSASGILG